MCENNGFNGGWNHNRKGWKEEEEERRLKGSSHGPRDTVTGPDGMQRVQPEDQGGVPDQDSDEHDRRDESRWRKWRTQVNDKIKKRKRRKRAKDPNLWRPRGGEAAGKMARRRGDGIIGRWVLRGHPSQATPLSLSLSLSLSLCGIKSNQRTAAAPIDSQALVYIMRRQRSLGKTMARSSSRGRNRVV